MSLHLRSIKTEARILAIDTCNKTCPLGVVYRGGLYLDGVLRLGRTGRSSGQIGREIRQSKYFPELRILMLHDPSQTIILKTIHRETKLPMLTVSTQKPKDDVDHLFFRGRLGRIWVKTMLDKPTVQRILDLTWTTSRLPEPLRVAHLLARSIRFSAIDTIKDKSRPGS